MTPKNLVVGIAASIAILSLLFYFCAGVIGYYRDAARVDEFVAKLQFPAGTARSAVEATLMRLQLEWESSNEFDDRIGNTSVAESARVDATKVKSVIRVPLPDIVRFLGVTRTSAYFFFDQDNRLLAHLIAKRNIAL